MAALLGLPGCGGGGGGDTGTAAVIPDRVMVGGTEYRVSPVEVSSRHTTIESIDRRGTLAGTAAFVDLVGFVRDASATRYVPGTASSVAYGIGGNGDVVGLASDCNFNGLPVLTHGFAWQPGAGTLVRVTVPDAADSALGPSCVVNTTRPYDVNAAGVIAGEYADAAGVRRGFVGPVDALSRYEPPAGAGTVREAGLRAINAAGELAGELVDGNGVRRAFVHRTTGFAFIDVPGAAWSSARDVSDAGLVAGYFADAQGVVHGFVLRGAVLEIVTIPGTLSTQVNGVNDAGLIVGTLRVPEPEGGGARSVGFVLTPSPADPP